MVGFVQKVYNRGNPKEKDMKDVPDINKKAKDFWEDCHNKQIIPSLSGCGYDETIKWLQVEGRLSGKASFYRETIMEGTCEEVKANDKVKEIYMGVEE
jgi:hypothetical protein